MHKHSANKGIDAPGQKPSAQRSQLSQDKTEGRMCFISSSYSTSACSAGTYWLKACLSMSILRQSMLGDDVMVVKSSYRT